jgi:hypothetical protein
MPLRWSEVPITFSRADQWTSFSKPGRFPLVLKPIVAGSRLNKVLIDGGSGLNFIFTKTLDKMKLDITHMLTKSASPFYGIVLGNVTIPLSSVVLPVTFGETRENYRTEYIKFEVADFETSIHAILGRPSIAKFMEVPHYTYLILKMPSPAGVLSLQGDLKISFDCDTEVVELATTNQVPNPMMEIYAASKKLAPTELEIPKKTGTTNNPQPSEEVCWGEGYPKIQIRSPNTREESGQMFKSKSQMTKEETKNLLMTAHASKVVNPFTHALAPPFIGRRRDFYIPKIPSNLGNIPSVNMYMNVLYIP